MTTRIIFKEGEPKEVVLDAKGNAYDRPATHKALIDADTFGYTFLHPAGDSRMHTDGGNGILVSEKYRRPYNAEGRITHKAQVVIWGSKGTGEIERRIELQDGESLKGQEIGAGQSIETIVFQSGLT